MKTAYEETAEPEPATTALEGDYSVEIAIVGAGITGLSTALHLAEQGRDVAVVDAEGVGWGASGRNGGQVNPGLKHSPDRIVHDFGQDRGRRIVALAHGAADFVAATIGRLGIDCDFVRTGTLRLAKDKAQGRSLDALDAQYRAHGLSSALLAGHELCVATGTDAYSAGMLDPRGGHLNPLGYTRGLARGAIRAGARIVDHNPVVAMRRDGDAWLLESRQGTIRCRAVVLATNGYTDGLWPGLKRTVVPAYSAIAATEPLPERIAEVILPCRAATFELGLVTVYYRIDASNRFLIGGRSSSRDIAEVDKLGYLIDYSRELWPPLRDAKWALGWNGQIAITRDHYPHIHSLAKGVWAGLGYNGRGVAMATVMGDQLARAVVDDIDGTTLPPTGLSPFPLHALWPMGVAIGIKWDEARQVLGL